MNKIKRFVFATTLTMTMAGSAQPLAATTVQECYEKVLGWCSRAMEDSNFFTRIAIGDLCVAMLVGCTVPLNK